MQLARSSQRRLGGPPGAGAYPIVLVLGEVMLGFIPGLPQVPLNPGLILFIVLPPVLYQAALFTS
jgi:monovalent cation/hydrogen antiporter